MFFSERFQKSCPCNYLRFKIKLYLFKSTNRDLTSSSTRCHPRPDHIDVIPDLIGDPALLLTAVTDCRYPVGAGYDLIGRSRICLYKFPFFILRRKSSVAPTLRQSSFCGIFSIFYPYFALAVCGDIDFICHKIVYFRYYFLTFVRNYNSHLLKVGG